MMIISNVIHLLLFYNYKQQNNINDTIDNVQSTNATCLFIRQTSSSYDDM